MIKRTDFILILALIASSLQGCTFVRQSVAALRSTDHFIAHRDEPRVLFEPGAEDYADVVASKLPSAIVQVEEKQYRSFVKPVRVYICASRESFARMYGADVRAGVLTKLFISPRAFDSGNVIAGLYLVHELSHLHIQDHIGNYRMSRLPFWFKEGLAAYVSGGGGAQTVTEKQAADFIRAGRHFVPEETGGIIFNKTPGSFGLEPHMFYRQSMMFIDYLSAVNKPAFRKLLLAIEKGERLSAGLKSSYNKNLEELWKAFLDTYSEGRPGLPSSGDIHDKRKSREERRLSLASGRCRHWQECGGILFHMDEPFL